MRRIVRRWLLILPLILSIFLFSSCVFQAKPVLHPYPWNFVEKPPETLKGVVKCSIYCSNGTDISGKAIVIAGKDRALVKVYGPAGVYGGKIVMKNGEVFADEDLAYFASYLSSPQQLKSILTGYIYDKSYKIITPYILQLSFGKLKERYVYDAEGIRKVVISDGVCRLVIKPVKVIEVKK